MIKKKAIKPLLLVLLPLLLFYIPSSVVVVGISGVVFLILIVIHILKERSVAVLKAYISNILLFIFSLSILYLIAPRGGLIRRVGPIECENCSLKKVVSVLESRLKCPILVVNDENDIVSEKQQKHIIINFSYKQGTAFTLKSEFYKQTGMKLSFCHSMPISMSLSGHYDVLSAKITIGDR